MILVVLDGEPSESKEESAKPSPLFVTHLER